MGVNIGTPGGPPGQLLRANVLIRLCAVAPEPSTGGCAATVAQADPPVNNYGATVSDVGDVGVSLGGRYWLIWYQPAMLGGSTWVTYWWDGGDAVATSASHSALVRGYNR